MAWSEHICLYARSEISPVSRANFTYADGVTFLVQAAKEINPVVFFCFAFVFLFHPPPPFFPICLILSKGLRSRLHDSGVPPKLDPQRASPLIDSVVL